MHSRLHQGITLDPLGSLQHPPDTQLQSFLASSKTDAPIFFLYYLLDLNETTRYTAKEYEPKKGKTIDKQDNIHINRAKEKVQKSKQMNTDTTKHIAPKTQSKNRSEENIKSNMLTT